MALPARAQPAAPAAAPLTPEEQKALEKALGADTAAQAAKQQAAPPSALAPPTAPAVPQTSSSPLVRAFQSLNPDISAILDVSGGYYSDGATLKSGDDPAQTGVNIQEVELAFQATVDPYFRADVFLTIPNLQGLEVEEAFLTTTSLPGSLQLRAGIFRAPFGRQNTQHLHLQDFTRRPSLNALFLGPDGLRSPGFEVSWLVPVPFYLLVTADALSVGAPDGDPASLVGHPMQSFGGGERKDLTYLGSARTFAALSDNTSLLLGLSFATGNSWKQTAMTGLDPMGPVTYAVDIHRSYLYGADAYLKWKPPNVAQTYSMIAWTTEFMLRHIPELSRVEGGLYSQVVWQAARRWFLGLRGEIDGLPSGPEVLRQYAAGASATWALSEFSRVRLYGEGRYTPGASTATPWASEVWSYAGFLQFEAAIGAHGAHPY